MKILISTRRNRTEEELAFAQDALRRCAAKHGFGSAVLDFEFDWSSPDGEPEKFLAAVCRVIPAFDVLILIECHDDQGHPLIARGQLKCAEVALARGSKVFVYRDDTFLRVESFVVANPKGWKDGYARAITSA